MTRFQGIGNLSLATACCFLAMPDLLTGVEGNAASPAYKVVERSEVLAAMRQQGDYDLYDLTATTNGAWFQAKVVFFLARCARQRDPNGPPLFIGYGDWFRSFLEVTGRTASTAPQYALLSYRHRQNMAVEYRPNRVIREVKKGPPPKLALNVQLWWESGPGKPDRYSYVDTLSTSRIKVTNRRVITYRLLDLGDWTVYDEIKGITGRPMSGVLTLLFRVIGGGRIAHSRMAISKDGIQVFRTTAKKAFMKATSTLTVYPDGTMEKGIPDGRAELLELEQRLKQPLEIDYVELSDDR